MWEASTPIAHVRAPVPSCVCTMYNVHLRHADFDRWVSSLARWIDPLGSPSPPKESPLNSVAVRHGDVSLLQRQPQHSCGQQLRLPPRAAQQQHVQRKLSSNKSSAVGLAGHGCALDLVSRMRAAVHDKAHSDAVVGSTGLVREGAPLGQIQRARSLEIQRGARSQAIQRVKSHPIKRAAAAPPGAPPAAPAAPAKQPPSNRFRERAAEQVAASAAPPKAPPWLEP